MLCLRCFYSIEDLVELSCASSIQEFWETDEAVFVLVNLLDDFIYLIQL